MSISQARNREDKMVSWITNNFWIKVISLILALVTWFYVNEELIKEKQLAKQFYKTSIITKTKNPSRIMDRTYSSEKK